MKIYDPKTLFATDKIHYASDGINARLACPCHLHTNRNQINASFNMVTGEYISFGKCNKKFGKGQLSNLLVWLRDECDLESSVSMIERSEIEMLIQKEDDSWREKLSLPLAINSNYLNKRGVSEEIIRYFDLRHDLQDTMIVYPLRDFQDKIVGLNTRYTNRVNQRYQVFGDKVPLAGMDLISKNKDCTQLFVTEGMFGQFNLYSFGYCSMSLLGSSGNIPLEIISRYDKIYLCVDNDEAGYNKAIQIFMKNPSIIVMSPNEFDEINKIDFDSILNDITKQAISISGIKRLWKKG